jgi:hypothetical protein
MAICTHHSSADGCFFSMAMPKEAAHCYKHICHPITGVVPTFERILQDVNKAINALQVIYKAEGVYILGLADGRMAGHRHTTTNDGKKPRGRKRARMNYNHALATSDIHHDLLTALNEFDEKHLFALVTLAFRGQGE